jgi:[acyl-carrier-protein] S-malonyltransferase
MKRCFLYPGQGAQYPGMGKDLWDESGEVKQLFELASDSTAIDMKKLIFEGSEEQLKATDKTQVAITLINLSASSVLKARGIGADGTGGFSLGEYSALYEAGVIRLEDLFPIVKARGELMEKASRNQDSPSGNPGMAAVIGLSFEKVSELLAGLDGVYLANYNSPVQIVVSGTHEGLERAEPAFKEAGARRFIRLKVSGPFHSPLLEEARAGLEEVLAGYSFSDPQLPLYANVSGTRVESGEEAKRLCVQQVVSGVRWVDEERCILSDGYDSFLEVGPGTVLTGLWKYVSEETTCTPAGKLEEINRIAEG